MSTESIMIHMIGLVGMMFNFVAFQCKKHSNIMIYKTTCEVIFAVQYFLFGAYVGTAMNIVGSVRNLVFAYLVAKGKTTKHFQCIFSVLFMVFGIFTWQGYVTLFMIAAKIVTTVAYGLHRNNILRLLTLPTSVCWLIYNYSSHSYEGALCEAFTVVSIITAIIRIDIIGREKPFADAHQPVKSGCSQ